MHSNHTIELECNWKYAIFILCLIPLAYIILQKIFVALIKHFSIVLNSDEEDEYENLPSFFDSIPTPKAHSLICEGQNMKDNFGFLFADIDTLSHLTGLGYPEKAITGTPWYTPTSNNYYIQKFCYIGAEHSHRHNLIEDGSPDNYDLKSQDMPEY